MKLRFLFKKGIRFVKDEKYRFFKMVSWGLCNHMSDEKFLLKLYEMKMDKKLNLENPQSFNEKLQWLKLHDRNPEYTKMVDKYEVRKYISEKIGEEYLVPLLGVWDSFDEIDFDKLPNQFVLKCTHDSGGIVICKDKSKLDIAAAKKKISKCMKRNFYWQNREWPYKNVKPRIIAEKFMTDESGTELKDYKIMCFNGKFRCSFVCSERYSNDGLRVTFFDTDWNKMPFERHYPSSSKDIKKPVNYEKMIELAETLAEGIRFVRIDFYEIQGKIYFGEITFFPGSGTEEFTPEEWDYKLGEMIKL